MRTVRSCHATCIGVITAVCSACRVERCRIAGLFSHACLVCCFFYKPSLTGDYYSHNVSRLCCKAVWNLCPVLVRAHSEVVGEVRSRRKSEVTVHTANLSSRLVLSVCPSGLSSRLVLLPFPPGLSFRLVLPACPPGLFASCMHL